MNRKNIIGIPIKNLEEPMSRLARTLDKNQRIALQIGLIKNLAECFRGKDNDIFLISNDSEICLLYTSPSPRDRTRSRMPSSA